MIKYKIVLAVSLLVCGIEGYCQQVKDTIIHADNYSKYIGLTCMLREDLIKSVKNGDSLSIKKFRNASVVLVMPHGQTISTKLLTVRENQMLQFSTGEYDALLSDIKSGNDYFLSAKKTKQGFVSPNFECGNLTLGILEFWKNQSENILTNIQQSALAADNKALLTFYWEAILLYIESGKILSPDINKKAADYLEEYPNTQYRNFLERLSSIKRIYQTHAMSLGLGFGKSYLEGPIDTYLKSDFTFDFELGYTFKDWHFRLGYRFHGFNYLDTMRLDHLDTLIINEGSYLEYHGFALKIGYTVFDNGLFRVQPYISGELNKLVNYIDIPDSTGIRQKGKTHPKLGIGTEAAIRLTKTLIKTEPFEYMYHLREEKDISYNPVYLNFRVGYYLNVFDKPTNVDGDIFFFTVGLEWMLGINQVNYRSKCNK